MAATRTFQLPSLRLEVLPSFGVLPSIEREAKAHQYVPTNLFGKSFEESIADLTSLVKSLEPRRKVNCPATPQLVVDIGFSPPSTPGYWTPPSNSRGLSRDVSPLPSPSGQRPEVPPNHAKIRTDERSQVLEWSFKALDSSPPSCASSMTLEPAVNDAIEAISVPISVPLLADAKMFMNQVDAAKFMHDRPSTALRDYRRQKDNSMTDCLSNCEDPTALHWMYEDLRSEAHVPTLSQVRSSPTSVGLGLPEGKEKQRRQRQNGPFICPNCPGTTFTRNFDMKRHMKSVHEKHNADRAQARTCPCCFEVLSREDAFVRHCRRVPRSCMRRSQQLKKPTPTLQPDSFYRSVRQQAEKTFPAQRGRKA